MNTRLLLIIPTIEPLMLWKRCLSSFSSSLIESSTLALVVYNGPDNSVSSDFSRDNVVMLGYNDCASVAQQLVKSADCSEELLFGSQEYGRSYGGSSNLLFAIAYSLRPSWIRKIDDDCMQMESKGVLWPDIYGEFNSAKEIYYGPYAGTPSGFLCKLSRETAIGWAKYIYSKKKATRLNELGTGIGGSSVKNGNLILPSSAIPVASYPVLFEPSIRTHARGEVYYWMSEFGEQSFKFVYEQLLQIKHKSSSRVNLESWLCSLALAFDLSRTYWHYVRTGKCPPILARRRAISEFKSWVLQADWPKDDIADILCPILEEVSLDFTERILSNIPKRRQAWKRLMKSNLSDIVYTAVPAIVDKTSEVWT